MAVTYYALTEFDGETVDNPGGLVRHRVDESGAHMEVHLGDGQWDDRYPYFAWLFWDPTHEDSYIISETAADKLMSEWPPSNLRPGLAPHAA